MTTPQAALLARCQAGDHEAFEELYRAYAPRVYSLAMRITGSREDAEDLLQEVFVLVYRRLAAFRGDASVSTWIHRIAVNRCVDHLRSKGARFSDASESLDDVAVPTTSSPRQESILIHRMDLERAIAMLPDGCRTAFVLHDVEGLQHSEIATLLGIATGTSKSQVHKARSRLRALLRLTVPIENGVDDVRRRVC